MNVIKMIYPALKYQVLDFFYHFHLLLVIDEIWNKTWKSPIFKFVKKSLECLQ